MQPRIIGQDKEDENNKRMTELQIIRSNSLIELGSVEISHDKKNTMYVLFLASLCVMHPTVRSYPYVLPPGEDASLKVPPTMNRPVSPYVHSCL